MNDITSLGIRRLAIALGELLDKEEQCKHLVLTVKSEINQLECKHCGEILEPMDVLVQIARGERTLV